MAGSITSSKRGYVPITMSDRRPGRVVAISLLGAFLTALFLLHAPSWSGLSFFSSTVFAWRHASTAPSVPFDGSLLPHGLREYLFSEDAEARPYPFEVASDGTNVHSLTAYRAVNHKEMKRLGSCLGTADCEEEGNVVIFGSRWTREAVLDGWRGGEGVWARSMYNTCKELGYTCLMGDTSYEETLWMYGLFPDLVKIIIQSDTGACHFDEKCVYSETNEDGIPAWKLFDMDFFPEMWASSKLKGPWVVNAEPSYEHHPHNPRNQTYLGYSLEEDAELHPVVKVEERENRAWVFAKTSRYFYHGLKAWPTDFYARLSAEPSLGLTFSGGYKVDDGTEPVEGIENLGVLAPDDFVDVVSRSKVLLGVGDPLLSPTPFVALGQGVPFVNPVLSVDESDPDNCEKWSAQHQTLRCVREPYVYNVRAGDYDALLSALERAIANPIARHFMPWATQEAHAARFRSFVETDWESEARVLLEKRTAEGRPEEELWYM